MTNETEEEIQRQLDAYFGTAISMIKSRAEYIPKLQKEIAEFLIEDEKEMNKKSKPSKKAGTKPKRGY